MSTFIYILALILVSYLTLSGGYQFILALASKRKAKSICRFDGHKRKILVLVPAYKEDQVILHSTKRNMSLKYKYPKAQFDYVVISDGLKSSTNKQLESLGAQVLPVRFEKSTKVKSLQAAISKYEKEYDGVVILDADNVVSLNLLYKASHYLSCGFGAIQGLRTAANSQSSIALMDGLSETANTEMLCKGANRLGFSSKLSGSGMVFDYKLFKSLVFDLNALGGFDKELEIALTQRKEYIHYAEDIIVYDEKVSHAQAFAKQRGRWLQAQYTFFFKSIIPAIKGLAEGKMDHFHKVMQLALPPRVLAPIALVVIGGLSILLGANQLMPLAVLGSILTFGAYLLVLPFPMLVKNGLRIAGSLPSLIWAAIKALRFMKASKETFLHTKHELTGA